jgi:hypothetical protein
MTTTTTTRPSTTDHPTAATPAGRSGPRHALTGSGCGCGSTVTTCACCATARSPGSSALTGISVGVVATYEDRYTTPEELALFADMEGIPAFEAMLGRLVQLTTVEGAPCRAGACSPILAAVWGMLAGARLLRRAEERGHLEKLRAGVVSPRGLTLSAIAALLTTHAVFAVALGASHQAAGMDAGTSWALGGAMGLLTAASPWAARSPRSSSPSYRRAVGIVGACSGCCSAAGARRRQRHPGLDVVDDALRVGHLPPPADEAWATVFAALGALVVVLLVAVLWFAQRDLHAAARRCHRRAGPHPAADRWARVPRRASDRAGAGPGVRSSASSRSPSGCSRGTSPRPSPTCRRWSRWATSSAGSRSTPPRASSPSPSASSRCCWRCSPPGRPPRSVRRRPAGGSSTCSSGRSAGPAGSSPGRDLRGRGRGPGASSPRWRVGRHRDRRHPDRRRWTPLLAASTSCRSRGWRSASGSPCSGSSRG